MGYPEHVSGDAGRYERWSEERGAPALVAMAADVLERPLAIAVR